MGMSVIFFLTFLLILVNQHLKCTFPQEKTLDAILQVFIGISIIQILFAVIIYFILPVEYQYINYTNPFLFCYAPLLYFVNYAINVGRFSKRRVLLHSLPFAVFFLFYLYYTQYFSIADLRWNYYFYLFYAAAAVLFFVYGCLIFLEKKKMGVNYIVVTFWGLLELTLGLYLFFYAMALDQNPNLINHIHTRIWPYLVLLLAHFVLYFLLVYRAKPELFTRSAGGFERLNLVENAGARELKSSYPPEELSAYLVKIELYLNSKRLPDKAMDIHKVSRATKLSPKTIMEVLRLSAGSTFHNYLIGKRILLACTMLIAAEHINQIDFDNLYDACGFGSKASFYRNFKHKTGFSPMEYYQKYAH